MTELSERFEAIGSNASKQVFAGLEVSVKEKVIHNIYWQYVQVKNRGFQSWLNDCETNECEAIMQSLHEVGLIDVAEITEEALEHFTASGASCSADTDLSFDKRYEAKIPVIENSILEYMRTADNY